MNNRPINSTLEVNILPAHKDINWFNTHPSVILKDGQVVNLRNEGKYKIGNGTTQLSALPFWPSSAGAWGTISGNVPDQTDLITYLNTNYQLVSAKGANSGYAPLDSSGKIPLANIPASAITNTFVVNSQVAMLALSSAETGDIAVRTDENKTYILQGTNPAILGSWQLLLTPTDNVLSVNNKTGIVVLDTGDIAEGSNLYFTSARARTANAVGTGQIAFGAASTGELVGSSSFKWDASNNALLVGGIWEGWPVSFYGNASVLGLDSRGSGTHLGLLINGGVRSYIGASATESLTVYDSTANHLWFSINNSNGLANSKAITANTSTGVDVRLSDWLGNPAIYLLDTVVANTTSNFSMASDGNNLYLNAPNNEIRFKVNGSTYASFGIGYFSTSTSSNSNTGFFTTNASSGGNAMFEADSNSGRLQIFKNGSTIAAYKNILANDAGIYTNIGNMSFLNDAGNINWAAGAATSAQMILTSSGQLAVGVSTPTANLHIKAGTSAANTSPMKYDVGVLLVTPEVGAFEFNNAFYNTTGSGLRVAIGGMLYHNITDQSNVTTGKTTLYSYTLIPNALQDNGDSFEYEVSGVFANHATATKTLTVELGTTILLNSGGLVTAGINWKIRMRLTRITFDSCRYDIIFMYGSTTVLYNFDIASASGLDFTVSNAIKITAQAGSVGAASAQITAKTACLKWFPMYA